MAWKHHQRRTFSSDYIVKLDLVDVRVAVRKPGQEAHEGFIGGIRLGVASRHMW